MSPAVSSASCENWYAPPGSLVSPMPRLSNTTHLAPLRERLDELRRPLVHGGAGAHDHEQRRRVRGRAERPDGAIAHVEVADLDVLHRRLLDDVRRRSAVRRRARRRARGRARGRGGDRVGRGGVARDRAARASASGPGQRHGAAATSSSATVVTPRAFGLRPILISASSGQQRIDGEERHHRHHHEREQHGPIEPRARAHAVGLWSTAARPDVNRRRVRTPPRRWCRRRPLGSIQAWRARRDR